MNWAADLSTIQWVSLVTLALAGGLDRTALAQTLLCRPIVCGSLCGLIMGNYTAGMLMGAVMELLWLMRLPVGATIAPDDTQATIAAVFLFCGFNTELHIILPEQVLMVVVLFFAALFAPLGRLVDIGARHMNGRIQHQAQSRLERASSVTPPCFLRWANLAGLVNFSLAGLFSQVIILCATLASIVLVVPLLERLTWQMAGVPVYAALIAGVGAVYACITVRYGVILFGTGFGITLFFTLV
ncbi:MAG: PTS sugar transporter subunit IIC [Desulfuromonadaceae bacterium]